MTLLETLLVALGAGSEVFHQRSRGPPRCYLENNNPRGALTPPIHEHAADDLFAVRAALAPALGWGHG